MARYFLRLKFTLVRNGLRVGWRRRVGLVLGVFVWAWIVVGGLALIRGGGPRSAGLPLVFDIFFVGWLVFPLLGFGTDETLDPSRLALLPLPRRTLMAGLAVATLAGLAPVATLVTVSGALTHAPSPAARVIVGAAVLLELLLCVVGSRAVTTAFSGILRSRRGKDVLVFVIALIAVLPAVVGQVVPRLVLRPGSHGLALGAGGRSLFWLPSGWAARAVLEARGAHYLPALIQLAGVAGVIAFFAWIWSVALERTLTTSEGAGATRASKGADLFARPLGLLPHTRIGAIAAKELRYTWRDPRRRAALVTVLLFTVLPVVAFTHGTPSPRLILLTAGGALVFGLQALNQFGTDGAAFWINVASGRDPAVDFRGKNLASSILGLSVVSMGALGLGLLLGGWVYVPAAILLAGAVMGVALGVANQVSVLVPFPLPDAVTNLWAGPGCLTALSGLLAVGVIGALLIPVMVVVGLSLSRWPSGLLLACLLSALYGLALWRVGLGLATRRLRIHELDCLEIITGRRGA